MSSRATAPAPAGTPARIGEPVDATRSQTLHRGLSLLALVAEAVAPPTLPDLVVLSGLHRSVVYRLLRTLEDHRLVERTPDERYLAGIALLTLGRSVAGDLRSTATVVLRDLADSVGMTAFLVVRDADEAVTLASVEPTMSASHVTYRPGNRHPVDRGAPGLALLAAAKAQPGERAEVEQTRAAGWVFTSDEVLPGLSAVAAPVAYVSPAAVCVVFAGRVEVDSIAAAVTAAASTLGDRVR